MKAERRQELRTNELAQWIEQGRTVMRTWGSYIVGGIVVVVLIIAFVAYRASAANQEISDAWQNLREMPAKYFFTAAREKQSDDQIKAGFDGLRRLADTAKSPDLVFEALANEAQIAIQLSKMGSGGVDPVYLTKAEEAYTALKTRLADNPLAVATALNGAVAIEADRFVVDGSLAHKENARRLLEQLKSDARFANTPFQTAALDRLNRLDAMFTKVELAPAPPAPPPVALTPSDGKSPETAIPISPGSGPITVKPSTPAEGAPGAQPAPGTTPQSAAPPPSAPEPKSDEPKPE